jgi:hypothetical protein
MIGIVAEGTDNYRYSISAVEIKPWQAEDNSGGSGVDASQAI